MVERLALQLHPDFTCEAATHIEVEVARSGPSALTLRYIVTGTPAELQLPVPLAPTRAERLWEHTCFEIFVRAGPDESYHEFNFAPSHAWAAYRFESHRSGMSDASIVAPLIEAASSGQCFELRSSLDLGDLPQLPPGTPWRLGLSAVIEETCGRKSYWALAHPPGQADFHHPDCFALELPAARQS